MDDFPSTILPNAVTSKGTVFNTKIIKYENGSEQRYGQYKNPKKKYTLSWNLMSTADFNTLNNFFIQQKGQLKAWIMTDPRIGTNVTLRFNSDELIFEHTNANYSNVTVEVITC